MANALIGLTSFQRDLLYVVAGQTQPSGQDLKEAIEAAYGWEITHGRLYPNLDALHEDGYLEKGQLDRRTNYYELRPMGEDALQERRAWQQRYVGEEW